MAKLETHRVPVLRDNYVWLAHEASSNLTAAVDPAVVDPVLAALDVQGWSLTHILNTHHHHDHTGGNLELKKKDRLHDCRFPFRPRADSRDRCRIGRWRHL